MPDFERTIRIPVVTDLVRPGDPAIILQSKQDNTELHDAFEQRLKERIAELQEATGQDEYKSIARAHAIRSENQRDQDDSAPENKPDYEQTIDKARQELIRDLSTMLK